MLIVNTTKKWVQKMKNTLAVISKVAPPDSNVIYCKSFIGSTKRIKLACWKLCLSDKKREECRAKGL